MTTPSLFGCSGALDKCLQWMPVGDFSWLIIDPIIFILQHFFLSIYSKLTHTEDHLPHFGLLNLLNKDFFNSLSLEFQWLETCMLPSKWKFQDDSKNSQASLEIFLLLHQWIFITLFSGALFSWYVICCNFNFFDFII